MLNHFAVYLKIIQHCKSTILQFKKFFKKRMAPGTVWTHPEAMPSCRSFGIKGLSLQKGGIIQDMQVPRRVAKSLHILDTQYRSAGSPVQRRTVGGVTWSMRSRSCLRNRSEVRPGEASGKGQSARIWEIRTEMQMGFVLRYHTSSLTWAFSELSPPCPQVMCSGLDFLSHPPNPFYTSLLVLVSLFLLSPFPWWHSSPRL